MCCLFGLLDIKHHLSAKEKNRILSILGTFCEARGIDATGYSYVSDRNLIIKKKAIPAHEMTFNIPKDKIVEKAFSGKTMDRPNFQKLLEALRAGGTLVVCKLDRFARTAIEGVQTVRDLFNRGIRVHILNMGLIENTLTGNLILAVMLAFTEYERGMIVELTQTGKAAVKLNPNFRDGRPKKFTSEQLPLGLMLLEQGKTYRQIRELTGISKSTLSRAKNGSTYK